MMAAIQSIEGPSALADLAVAYMDVKPEEKQEILETLDISARIDKVSRLLAHRIEVLRLSQEIGRQTRPGAGHRLTKTGAPTEAPRVHQHRRSQGR
jgi:ATP-dependent Lon protease